MSIINVEQGFCFMCSRMFYFNSQLVPAFVVSGIRYPVCKDCMNIINAHRVTDGAEPMEIHPDAYTTENGEVA